MVINSWTNFNKVSPMCTDTLETPLGKVVEKALDGPAGVFLPLMPLERLYKKVPESPSHMAEGVRSSVGGNK